MGLTPLRLLEYLSVEELKFILSIINEPQTGNRQELMERIIIEWSVHNKKWSQLLGYFEKPILSTICQDYNIDHRGTKDVLERRLRKEMNGRTKSKTNQTTNQENKSHLVSLIPHNKRDFVKIGLFPVAALIIGMLWTSYVANEQNSNEIIMENVSDSVIQIFQGENIFVGTNVIKFPDNTEQEVEELNLQSENKVNLFYREIRKPLLEDGIYRLIFEFGTQTDPKGADISLTFNTKYIKVQEAFAKPFQNSFPVEGEVLIKTGMFEHEPPKFATKFSQPKITSSQSYYVYFESLEPLDFIDGHYNEYIP